MEPLFAVLGIALVLTAVVDALWTTLWVDGAAGPVTGRLTTWSWRLVLKLGGRRHHKALSLFGPTILMGTVVTWVLLLLAGWVLLFASDPRSLQVPSDAGLADWTGRIWYVAYSMFTVGNGDFTPQEGLWQIVSSVVSGSGMFVVTLAISYVLSVLSAVVGKRAFAGAVTGLGSSPEEFVLSGWDGRDLHALDRELSSLSGQLARLTQQYQSYPVLQYYHGAEVSKSPIKAVAIFDDALTLMRFGVTEEARPSVAALTSSRSGVRSFLDALEQALMLPAPDAPPHPSLQALRERGVPTASDGEFDDAVGGLADRRCLLRAVVRSDGWRWED